MMLFGIIKHVYSESSVCTLYIEIKQLLTKISFGQSVTKNALFFLSGAPTYHNFTTAEARGSSLLMCVWDFPFSIPPHFY